MLETCLTTLRQHAFRPTPLRVALLTLLHAAVAPLSVPALERKIRARGLSPNKTTVYRTLELLEHLGLVERTVINEQRQYFELTERGHHHHFVCTGCENILDVLLQETPLLREVRRLSERIGFVVTGHMLDFYGLCATCLSEKVGAHRPSK